MSAYPVALTVLANVATETQLAEKAAEPELLVPPTGESTRPRQGSQLLIVRFEPNAWNALAKRLPQRRRAFLMRPVGCEPSQGASAKRTTSCALRRKVSREDTELVKDIAQIVSVEVFTNAVKAIAERKKRSMFPSKIWNLKDVLGEMFAHVSEEQKRAVTNMLHERLRGKGKEESCGNNI